MTPFLFLFHELRVAWYSLGESSCFFFKLNFVFAVTVDSHAVLRSNRGIPCTLYSVPPNTKILALMQNLVPHTDPHVVLPEPQALPFCSYPLLHPGDQQSVLHSYNSVVSRLLHNGITQYVIFGD